MATAYRTKYNLDWPLEFSDLMIDLSVAKKWRLFQKQGWDLVADPGDCLESAMRELFRERLVISPWTRQMIHDFANEDKYAMIGCGSCGKSYAMAALGLAYWFTDPLNTSVVIGSATLTDLQTRAWAPTLELFTALKGNDSGVQFPGKIVTNVYAIVNERDADIAETSSRKASIQGRALDEGRTQGLHGQWILFIVDELGIVKDMNALKKSLTNARIGTLGFKFMSAANPKSWDSPNSCYYLPPKGVTVDVDTGSWRSQMGYLVRHFDGLKSPCVLNPELEAMYPFLMKRDDVRENLIECGDNPDSPLFWEQTRGFPMSSGSGYPTVLDPLVASQSRCAAAVEPPMSGGRVRIGLVAGVDPAWTESGDAAIYAGCEVVEQDGRALLDFGGRVSQLPISVRSEEPVTKQLRDGVIRRVNADGGPSLHYLYGDSSGNQGLCDDLDIYVGPGCGHINSSRRASDLPLRALDARPAREHVYDRGTEAAMVLAEFIRAGQVRGLPQKAVDALVQRRFMTRPKSNDPVQPLRLEGKEGFITRFKGSPNECDACSLAALAAKERLGVIPFGGVPPPRPGGVIPDAAPAGPAYSEPDADYGGGEPSPDGY